MSNLLPKEEQQLITREYHLRLVGAGLFFFACLVIVALVALVPLSVLLSQKDEAVTKAGSKLKEEVALGSKEDLSDILEISGKKAATLSAETQTLYFYQLIARILEKKASGVKIAGVNFTRSADGGHTITIAGKAKDRGALLAFAGALEGIKDFTEVTVPVSNFAPVSDINFSILAKTK